MLTTLSMNKGKYGNLGCISGWFGALRETPRITVSESVRIQTGQVEVTKRF